MNAIARLEFVEVFGAESVYCEIHSDESDGSYWLGLDWVPGGLDQVAGLVDDAVEIEIAGLPAMADERTVWVAKGGRMLQVTTAFGGREATEGVDPSAFAAAVAEIIVPRLIEE